MIAYMYRTLKSMTLAEDRAMREYLLDFITKKGDNVLRSKGDVLLPNGLKYNVLAVTDRENKVKRDNWVVEQHKKLVSAGKVDKEFQKDETPVKTKSGKTIIIIRQ